MRDKFAHTFVVRKDASLSEREHWLSPYMGLWLDAHVCRGSSAPYTFAAVFFHQFAFDW